MKLIRRNIIRVLTCIFLTGFILSCDTERTITPPYDDYFLKYYGEDGDQQAVDLIANSDGTFILLGSSSIGQGMILIKADAKGNTLWKKKFGNPVDVPIDIEATLDGNYVLLSNYPTSINNVDIKLLRIDQDGNKIDSVVHGTIANDYASSVTSVSDGGFIVAGRTEYNPQPGTYPDRKSSFLHFRCRPTLVFYKDSEGLWNDIDGYGNGSNVSGNINGCTKVYENSVNSFYIFGYSNAQTINNANNKLALIYYRLTNQGEQGDVNYLTSANDDIQSNFITYVPSPLLEGYLIISTANKGTAASKLHVSKLKTPLHSTPEVDSQFDQNLLGSRRLDGIYATPSFTTPQGYLVVSNETDDKGETNILLTKINQSGDELWSTNYGANKSNMAAAVAELPDGKIVILCTIQLDVQSKIALMKLNSNGQFLK